MEIEVSEKIFQQDNAPCHVSKAVNEWFEDQNLNVLEWPPQSPDLNLIENVLGYLENSLRKRGNEIKNKADLKKIIEEEWYLIPNTYIENLYLGYYRRIKALKNSKFDVTGY